MSRREKRKQLSSSGSGSDSSGSVVLEGIDYRRRTVVTTSTRREELIVIINTLHERDLAPLQEADTIIQLISLARRLDLWQQVKTLSSNNVWAPIYLRDFGPVQFRDKSAAGVQAVRDLREKSNAWKEVERFMTAKLALSRSKPSIETGTQKFIQTERPMEGGEVSREVRRVDMPVSLPVPRDETTLYKAWYEYEQRLRDIQWKNPTAQDAIDKRWTRDLIIPRQMAKYISDIFAADIDIITHGVYFFILDDGFMQRQQSHYGRQDVIFELPQEWRNTPIEDYTAHAFGNRFVIVNELRAEVLVIELDIEYKESSQVTGNDQTIFSGVIAKLVNAFHLKHDEVVLEDGHTFGGSQVLFYQSRLLVAHIAEAQRYDTANDADDEGSDDDIIHEVVVGVYALGITTDEPRIDQRREYDVEYTLSVYHTIVDDMVVQTGEGRDVIIFGDRQRALKLVRLDSPSDHRLDDLDEPFIITNPYFSQFLENSGLENVNNIHIDRSMFCRGGIVAIPFFLPDPDESYSNPTYLYYLYLSDGMRHTVVKFEKFRTASFKEDGRFNDEVERDAPSYLFGNGYMLVTLNHMGDQTRNMLTNESDDIELLRYQDILKHISQPVNYVDDLFPNNQLVFSFEAVENVLQLRHLATELSGFMEPDYSQSPDDYAEEYLGGMDEVIDRDGIIQQLDIDMDNITEEQEQELDEKIESAQDEAIEELSRGINEARIDELRLDFLTDTFIVYTVFNGAGTAYAPSVFMHLYQMQFKDPIRQPRSRDDVAATLEDYTVKGSRRFYRNDLVPAHVVFQNHKKFAFGVQQMRMGFIELRDKFEPNFHHDIHMALCNGQYVIGRRLLIDTSRPHPDKQYLKLVSGKIHGDGDHVKSLPVENKLQLKK